ncbi:MAG: SDR family NAD(P)-dependent oxidoreductase [Gammaproteobacteria bacterium]|nr:SDR family NAD(P)-dependent oxidoreductase [Gammaproteobacteria bacterium]
MPATFASSDFFIGHLPTFTNLGFQCRKHRWSPSAWRFEGQRWLVTGASTGIGSEISKSAAAAGATVIAAARSADRLEQLEARTTGCSGRVAPLPIDLSLLGNVDRLVERIAQEGPLDTLINNVGVLLDDSGQTAEGRDVAFTTNLLGPYALTTRLNRLGLLKPNATIVTISSGGMYNAALEIDKLAVSRQGDGVLAYARHKRAQVELNAHWRTTAVGGQQFYVMHPGWVDTPGVARSLPLFRLLMWPLLRTLAAAPIPCCRLAAKRPAQSNPEGIWFDRALRPAHALASTRRGDDVTALVNFLDREMEQ